MPMHCTQPVRMGKGCRLKRTLVEKEDLLSKLAHETIDHGTKISREKEKSGSSAPIYSHLDNIRGYLHSSNLPLATLLARLGWGVGLSIYISTKPYMPAEA